MIKTIKFKKEDKVKLKGCPYDEQIPEELEKFIGLTNKIQIVTEILDVSNLKGTSGQWIKTNYEKEWIDSVWYKKADI